MGSKLSQLTERFYFSFPIQLLINHFRRSPALLLLWGVFFMVVTQNFANGLGVPFLFLDPEYLNQTGFISFFLVGFMVAGFVMAFHITSYIADGFRFTFLGALKRPFARFALNNSIIPFIFLVVYTFCIIRFQLVYEDNTWGTILKKLAGFYTGFLLMTVSLVYYFKLTNRDAFQILSNRIEKRLKKSKITRATVLQRLQKVRGQQMRVDSYIDFGLKIKKAYPAPNYLQKEVVVHVFNQNHLNAVLAELGAVALIFAIGLFQEIPFLQFPAAASAILTGTVIVMIFGAIAFWSRGYTSLVLVAILLLFNLAHQKQWVGTRFEALGLNYAQEPIPYTLESIAEASNSEQYNSDKRETLEVLNNWRAKFPEDTPPKMVLISTSGGGQRSALWTTRALQVADSLTQGALMDHTMFMSGSSGGLIGAAYYRELVWQQRQGNPVNPYSPEYLRRIGHDNLNPVIFSLLVNDLFLTRSQTITYAGQTHPRDRGVSFEEQLNRNTEQMLDKPITAYRQAEQSAQIPMLMVAPTVANDGRKMYISPMPVSYMGGSPGLDSLGIDTKTRGIDFRQFFAASNADSLRFLSALRMGATFPYITPNISLPSKPSIQIMDSGISDNFGVADAIRFLWVFQDWIQENTSGVILLTIRDSEHDDAVEEEPENSLVQKTLSPIKNIYGNWSNVQDIHNDDLIKLSHTYLNIPLHRIQLQYIPSELFYDMQKGEFVANPQSEDYKVLERASLNWRLTTLEKTSIIQNITIPQNQAAIQQLQKMLIPEQTMATQE